MERPKAPHSLEVPARAVHPEVKLLLDRMAEAGRRPFEELDPAEARSIYIQSSTVLQVPGPASVGVHDTRIKTSWGHLPIRIYRPASAEKQLLPTLVYLHGGGWVVGDLATHDATCRRLTDRTSCCVVSVDYRLAPECQFPAAIDDAALALRWVAESGREFGCDPENIAVGGDSAGGNIAAVMALMSRDGSLPEIFFQMLLYPVLDLSMSSDSYGRIKQGAPLTARTMEYFIDHYCPKTRDRDDWRASPLKAKNLSGAAPTLMLTLGNDPLSDEGRSYADRLEKEGVPVYSLHLSDHAHGMLTMDKLISMADPVLDFASAAFKNALERKRW